MTDWIHFGVALAAFFLSHLLPTRPGVRERLTGLMGRRLYFTLYGTMSLLVLWWVIVAAARAPFVELWPQTGATRWVPNLVGPVVWILIAQGIGMSWGWTLGGRRGARFNPEAPGFAAITRHPLLIALILWSAAHLAPNGDLAHVILFGSFLGLSVAAIPVFDGRARRALAPDEAARALAATSVLSLRPLVDPHWLKQNEDQLVPRTVAAVALWALVLMLHQPALGVSPLPF